jgi:hypothetical protein
MWKSISQVSPPIDQAIMTKIDDHNGERNIQPLVFRGKMWWFVDKTMYVYYTPTHWKYMWE